MRTELKSLIHNYYVFFGVCVCLFVFWRIAGGRWGGCEGVGGGGGGGGGGLLLVLLRFLNYLSASWFNVF